MDASERLSVLLALNQQLARGSALLEGDLLVSAFMGAARCGRRATACRPWPSHLFGGDSYDAAAKAVQALPGLAPGQLQAASDLQLQLLQWLLLQLRRRWVLTHCTASNCLAALQDAGAPASLAPAVQQACCVFKASPGPSSDDAATNTSSSSSSARQLVACHGTDWANLHSILHQGLLAGSGTRLQTTGAVFGHGVYMSTDPQTAFSFTKGREAWQHSMLGRHLRCLLVCAVDPKAAAATAKKPSAPSTYIVAPRPSDVQLLFVLVFSDDRMLGVTRAASHLRGSSSDGGDGLVAASGGRQKPFVVSMCWGVTIGYLALVVFVAVWRACTGNT